MTWQIMGTDHLGVQTKDVSPHRDYDNQIVKDRINRGEFHAIPQDLKSRNYYDENPWPPKQFVCGRCGFQYDGLVPAHNCGKGDYYPDALIYDFCTHCGDNFNQYDGRHTCDPYGKHCRRVELPNSTTYYMRVFCIGSVGRHHYDPDSRLAYVWVESLTGAGQFRYIGSAQGIERACLIMGLKVSDYERPYFTIDGIRMSDSGGNVIHREYRKSSWSLDGGSLVHTTSPFFASEASIAEKECSGSDLDFEWCVTHSKDWKDHDDRCNECGDELDDDSPFEVCEDCRGATPFDEHFRN